MNFEFGNTVEGVEVSQTGNKWIFAAILTVLLAVTAWYFLYYRKKSNLVPPKEDDRAKQAVDNAMKAQQLFTELTEKSKGNNHPELVKAVAEAHKATTVTVQAATIAKNSTESAEIEQAHTATVEALTAVEQIHRQIMN